MSEYKRLTRKDEKGRWVADANHFGLYIDTTGKTRYGDVEVVYGDIVNRLAELENKIESGELVEFPRKFVINSFGNVVVEWIAPLGGVARRTFETEQQADVFIEAEKARLRKEASR